jgi:hypothetical protein
VTSIPIGSSSIHGFSGCSAYICLTRIGIPPENISSELDFHWFPVDQWGSEAKGPQIRVPHIELPLEPL